MSPAAFLVALAAALACAPEAKAPVPVPPTHEAAYADDDTLFPRVRFCDGQVSLNDRCMVRHVKLNYKMAPTYVNGRPVGFC
jgi:hypothetical protein